MVPMIVVTDFSADVGDLGVIANAFAYHRLGHINLLGVMVGTSKDKAAGGVDAIRVYFNVPDGEVAIGTWQGAAFDPGGGGSWPDYIYDNYPHDLGLSATVPSSITEMRRLLAARTAADVVIVEVGPCNTLEALMDSTADVSSALDGIDLITASVESLYVMGGKFPTAGDPEWNFQQHPVSAAAVSADWPTPVHFAGDDIIGGDGRITNGTSVSTLDAGNLLRETYADADFPNGRWAWDEMCLLAAVWRNSGFSLTQGSNVVNDSTGVNTFTNGTGSHFYLSRVHSQAQYEAFINAITMGDPDADPIVDEWPAAMAWANMEMA